MAAAAATHATADAVARAVQHHFDDRGLSSHGTIEIEARLRGQERFAAPARDVACRLPVLTQAALARVADALARSGFVAAQKKPEVYASIVVDRAGCTDLPRCTMRVRLDDGEGGPRDGDTFEKFFRQGCTMAGMRHAWNARVFKCTFAREDDARAPVRVSAAVEAGNTSRRRFSPALERAMNELRRMKPGDFDAIDAARYTRTIRHITRRSLTDAAGVLRVDLSAVRMVPYGRQVDPASAPFAEYEVEVEWVGGLDGAAAAAAAARAVYDQATRTPAGCSRPRRAPGSRRASRPGPRAPAAGGAGRAAREAMPKVVPIRTVDDICGVTHWTNKADGVTAYLSPPGTRGAASRSSSRTTPPATASTWRGRAGGHVPPVGAGAGEGALYNSGSQTLLMGEYVTDPGARGDRGPVFLVFDALVVGGETLFDRAGLDDRAARARRVVDALAPGGDGARASVRLKAPVPLQGSPIAYAGNADGAVVRARGYKTDGLVLMGGGPLHRRKRTRPPVVKWKPRDEQTVDLLVHYDARRQGYFYLCADNLTATLGGRERSVYTYRPYVPPSGVRMPSAADAAAVRRRLRGRVPARGRGRLAFVRVREDKTARYIRSMRAVRAAMRTERHGHWRVSWAKHLRSEGRDGEDKALSRVPLEWLGHRQGRDRSTFSHGANNRAVADQTLRLAMGGEFDLGWLQRQQREGVLHGSYFVRAGDRAGPGRAGQDEQPREGGRAPGRRRAGARRHGGAPRAPAATGSTRSTSRAARATTCRGGRRCAAGSRTRRCSCGSRAWTATTAPSWRPGGAPRSSRTAA